MRLLGRGGQGEVYLARDVTLGRKVALKLIRSERVGSIREVERLLDEARATARLSHPYIVQVYAAGRAFIALEYIEGEARERATSDRD